MGLIHGRELGAGLSVMLSADASLNHLDVCSIVWYLFFSQMEKCEHYSKDPSMQRHFLPPFTDTYYHVTSTLTGPGEIVSRAHIGHALKSLQSSLGVRQKSNIAQKGMKTDDYTSDRLGQCEPLTGGGGNMSGIDTYQVWVLVKNNCWL